MIPNHYELNIARNGTHFANVVLPFGIDKAEAQKRSELIAMAIQEDHGEWRFDLSSIECVGRSISF